MINISYEFYIPPCALRRNLIQIYCHTIYHAFFKALRNKLLTLFASGTSDAHH